MRRLPAIVLGALLLAACGDDDDVDTGVVDRSRPVPADVQAFLDRVTDPSEVAFVADYDLLNKNGGGEHVVHVESDPPALTVTIDGTEVDLDDEPALAQYGIFSGFLSANPRAAIEATARREDAGDAELTQRDGLDCIAIPVQGAVASRWCLNDDGIFGLVDVPSVRYQLTSYEPG